MTQTPNAIHPLWRGEQKGCVFSTNNKRKLMSTYIITKTDLFFKGKVYAEGTKIDLSDEDKQGLDDYLIPTDEHSHSVLNPALRDGEESKSFPDLVNKTTIKKRNNK